MAIKKNALSAEMKRLLEFIELHGTLIRYEGGFWAEQCAELKFQNSVNGGYYVPVNTWFRTTTIIALSKRNLIKVTKIKIPKFGSEYPVECCKIDAI